MIDTNFWYKKKVFVTGHTGFKGSWLCIWLHSMGAIVKGYSLAPQIEPSLFEIANVFDLVESEINDIRDIVSLRASIEKFNPEIVFHLAAQPLVRESYVSPLNTYETNAMGTANLLESIRNCVSVKAIVNVTTDKCYENKEWHWGYRESDPMGGRDPYSSSKGCAELITASYRESFLRDRGVGVATARAGNVVGGGDWAADRLIPDIIKAVELGKPVTIRNPNSTRPWQHVLECISGYLILAERLYSDHLEFSSGWNFGPYDNDVRSVRWIVEKIKQWYPDLRWVLDEADQPHEASLLKLDISKATTLLGWKPSWSLEFTLEKIVQWNKFFLRGRNMQQCCINEIKEFSKHERG